MRYENCSREITINNKTIIFDQIVDASLKRKSYFFFFKYLQLEIAAVTYTGEGNVCTYHTVDFFMQDKTLAEYYLKKIEKRYMKYTGDHT